MTEEQKQNQESALGWFIRGCIATTIVGFYIFSDKEPSYLKFPESSEIRLQDVNGDSIEDVIERDGTVRIRNKDGTFSTLGELMKEEIATSVREKYTPKPEEIRNPCDNLDYKIKTDKLIVNYKQHFCIGKKEIK